VRKSDIAFGSEFSPEQVDLAVVLEMVVRHAGDRYALEREIEKRWFKAGDERAKNTILSLDAYKIIERDSPAHYDLTAMGQHLADLCGDEAELIEEFAKHIILYVPGGLQVVEVIKDLSAGGQDAGMTQVRDELSRRGLHVPKNGMHATRIRQWLEKAGVVTPAPHRIDSKRLGEIIGFDDDEIDSLSTLTREQKDFVRAFARLDVNEARSNEIASYAAELYGTRFPDIGITGVVLEPLRQLGLLDYKKTTTGRGAKPAIVYTTEKLNADVLVPLLNAVEKSAGAEYRALVRKALREILIEVRAEDTHIKGKALESLAAKLAFLADLDFVGWRLRGSTTGGAEVDLIVESTHPVYLRWNIQCKNKAKGSVPLDDVAKEVGIAIQMASNVVVVVSTGGFSADARKHARSVMQRTNLMVILIDGRDLDVIMKAPSRIVDVLRRAADEAKIIKKLKETE
jgi:site-specific DNA-methyltransferase (cytosine-N4-specific)